jgi:hypothetical protein
MKIFLMGASGMIGSRILAEAVARGHEVVAGARNPDRIAALPGVSVVQLDANDGAALAPHAAAADVYVSSVSPRSTGDAVAETAGYASALLEAGKAARRVVLVGGAGTLNLPDGSPVLAHLPDFILPEATGMKRLKEALQASTLNWVFIAPAATIEPGTRTGEFRVGGSTLMSDAQGESRISAEDYAVALLDEVESGAHRNAVISVAY